MSPLAERNGLLKQHIEPSTRGILFGATSKSIAHLSQDLRLSNDHGIQTAGNLKQMGNRLFVFIYIEVLCKFFTINAEPLFHKTADKVAAHMKNGLPQHKSQFGCR